MVIDSSDKRFAQVVELRGHIIDSLMLPRIMDELMGLGVEYEIQTLEVGQRKTDTSYALIEIIAPTAELLETAVGQARAHGAMSLDLRDADVSPAPKNGVFPDNFYSTTNLVTQVRVRGDWINARYPEMDCGIVLRDGLPECIAMSDTVEGEIRRRGRSRC